MICMASSCFTICLVHLLQLSSSYPVEILDPLRRLGYVDNTFHKKDGASFCRDPLSYAYKDTDDLFIKLAGDDDILNYVHECKPEPEIRLSGYAPAIPPSAIMNNKRDSADEPLNGDLERLVRRSHAENIRRMNCIRIFQNSGQLIAKCLQDRMMGTQQFQG